MAEAKVRDVTADTIASLEQRRAWLVRLGRPTDAIDAKLAALRGDSTAGTETPSAPEVPVAPQKPEDSGTPAADSEAGAGEQRAAEPVEQKPEDGTGAADQKQEDDVLEKKVEDQPLERAVPAAPSAAGPAQVHARKARAAGQRQQPPAKDNG